MISLCQLLLLACLSFPVQSNDSIEYVKIVTESWENYTNEDGTGLFLDITRAVFEPRGIRVEVEFVPYKRALNLLERSKADAMFGTYSADKEGKAYLFTPNNPIDKEQTIAIFKKSAAPQWGGPETMHNRNLAWVRGYDYDNNLDIEIGKISEVVDSQQGLAMLEAGRFDFFLDHSGALIDTINRTEFDLNRYRMEVVIEEDLHIAFANSERGRQLAQFFDTQIESLVASGELRKMFVKYGIHYPF